MTNPTYRPTNLSDALYRLSEECHELGKVACKAGRFGMDDTHPKKNKRNVELIFEEFEDIKDAVADVIKFYKDIIAASCKCGWKGTRDELMTWEIHEGEEGYDPMGGNDRLMCPMCHAYE